MLKFVNKLTGSIMWVADDRADEYRRLGFRELNDTHSEKSTKRTDTQKTERKTSTRRNSNKDDKERW